MKTKSSNTILPKDQSDKPDTIISRDKKMLSTLLVLLILLIAINLVIGFAAAIDNAVQERSSVAQVFMVIVTAVLDIILVVVMIGVAHNVSRSTAAVLKIAEKLLGGNVISTTDSAPQPAVANAIPVRSTPASAVSAVPIRKTNAPPVVDSNMDTEYVHVDSVIAPTVGMPAAKVDSPVAKAIASAKQAQLNNK